MSEFDAIVIGGGISGGIVAGVLAEAGKTVLLLERGLAMLPDEVSRDHLRNHRLSQYGHNTGPSLAGNPRVFLTPTGERRVIAPHEPGYNNNAMVLGGGGLVYGAQAWRFMPQDFRMASLYGSPTGSSLADWPVDYDTLAPFYDRAEWALGVACDGSRVPLAQGHRSRDYPLPPHEPTLPGAILQRGADALSWHTQNVPLAINTLPYNGRPACIQCGMCVGFGCPVDAKNGSQNTLLLRGLATGHITLRTQAQARRIDTDSHGNARGVTYLCAGEEHFATAKVVVSCCGAIESARLLLNSACDAAPRGLGNQGDQLGRNLQGHYYPGAHGRFDELAFDNIGPGPVIATTRFNHHNPGIIGGAMLANEFIKLPILFAKGSWQPGIPRWGLEAKRWMRHNYARVLQVQGPVQEIPSGDSRVSLDPDVKDAHGIPVVRLSGTTHPETVRTSDFIADRAVDWLRAAGAVDTWQWKPGLSLSAGQHQAGTCRMGHDPVTSVCDPTGRVHHSDNVFVADGSLHVTNGGFNPFLTIAALAFRTSDFLVMKL